MQKLFKHKIFVLAVGIFLLALLARVVLFYIDYRASGFNLTTTIVGDDGYYGLSQSVLAGHGLGTNPLRTPLYPYFAAALLWLTGSYWVVIAVQILLGSASAVLAFLIGKRLLSSLPWATGIGIFMALEPYHVQFSFVFYTETLFVFLFLLFVWQFLRYLDYPSIKNIFFAGLLLGLATMTKTTVQFLPIILGVFLLWHFRRNIKIGVVHTAVLGIMFLLVISPWLYRNYHVFGVVGMSAQPTYNLITYLVPSVLAIEEGKPIAESTFVKDHHIIESEITLANADTYTAQAIEILKHYPLSLVKVGLISVVTFFTHDGMLTVLQHAGYIPQTKLTQPALVMAVTNPLGLAKEITSRLATPAGLIVLFRLLNIVVTICFIAGATMLVFRKKHAAVWIFGLLCVGYFLATTPINGLGVNARFRMPVEPFILAVASLPAIVILRRWQHTDTALPHEQTLDSHPLL